MKSKTFIITAVILAFTTGLYAGEDVNVEYKPYSIWAVQEIGVLQGGVELEEGKLLKDEWVDHLGAALSQEVIINERFLLAIGIGGVFQFPKPEKTQAKYGGSQAKMFYVGPSVAQGVYSFGDIESPWLKIGTGMFPYKYNPDAHNLGEYLFRTTAYPMTISTGGLTAINSAGVGLQGFKANLNAGGLKLDVLLTTETSFVPFYDWALAAVASYSIADGLIEVGAGVNFKHVIPVNAEKTTPETKGNAYFNANVPVPRFNAPGIEDTVALLLSGDTKYYQYRGSFYNRKAADTTLAIDSATRAYYTYKNDSLNAIRQFIFNLDDSTLNTLGPEYYTNQSTFVMGRLSLDLKKLFGSEAFGSHDLKFYAEAAVLGVKDYPLFYEDITERIPVMFGFNLPCFKLLDLLAVQFEYFNSPWLNDHLSLGAGNVAIPDFRQNDHFSKEEYYDVTKEDNLTWSILCKKTILPGVTLSGQFARDHYRAIAVNWFYGSRQEPIGMLFRPEDWYWMFQLSWAM
jgi:hypothetical protein